jgi:hypothetical protein
MNAFLRLKTPAYDIPQYHDFVVSIGCLWEGEGPCSGVIDAHHWPPVSEGGVLFDLVGMCRAHHRAWHDRQGPFREIPSLEEVAKIKQKLIAHFFAAHGHTLQPAPDRKKRARGKNLMPPTKKVNQF